jgi:hypothetical protein
MVLSRRLALGLLSRLRAAFFGFEWILFAYYERG